MNWVFYGDNFVRWQAHYMSNGCFKSFNIDNFIFRQAHCMSNGCFIVINLFAGGPIACEMRVL